MITQPTSPSKLNDDSLGRAVGVSLGAHVLVVAAFVLRMVIYPTEPLTLDNAIRVDLVALPDKSPKLPNVPTVETKIPPPPAPPVPEPLPEKAEPEPPKPVAIKPPAQPKPESPKINLSKPKTTTQDALKRLAALEKIEHMTKSQSPGRAAPAPQPIKGNEISHGGSLSGVTRLEQQGYLQTIDGSVKAHWNLPGFLSNANLSARARLFIDASGVVLKRSITQSSRNDVYDSRVLAAIDAASPLPPPPKTLVSILEVDGIELEFVPQ